MRDWSTSRDARPRQPEMIIITGPVYSGKTTLARALARSLEEQGRSVLVIGPSARNHRMEYDDLVAKVGMEGVLIYDCPPHQEATNNPQARYINCGKIL